MDQNDLVSVVLPAYNAEQTLDATLNSVRLQTYRNLEITVVNDGSSDGTADVAERHAAEDDRIRVISIPNGGVAKARNTGIEATKGSYVAMIDSDDLWHPEKTALQVRAIQKGGQDVGYVYCLSRRIDEHDHDLGVVKTHPMQGCIYLRSIVFNPVGNGSAILARRSALEQAGGFDLDPELQEDNLIQIMMNRTWLAEVVPLYLTGYRVVAHSRSSDFNRTARGRFSVLRRVVERFPETPEAVILLAEGRIRAIVASQAFRSSRIFQGMTELTRACQLAPLCALEFAAVDTLARLRGLVRSIVSRLSSRKAQPGKCFLDCDPAEGVQRPPRPLEKRKLDALAQYEAAFARSCGTGQVTSEEFAASS